jgi:predicted nucleotidyltransferase component of viral defense system
LNRARSTGEDFNLILKHYAIERLLYRLSRSRHRSQFVLKGAMLLKAWTGRLYRPTQDLDLLGFGDESGEAMIRAFAEIVTTDVEPDGLTFDPASIRVENIREDQKYRGQRVRLIARLGAARVDVQVDVGFGDVVTPAAQTIAYPTLLDSPAPQVRAYSHQSVVAEKFQAIVALGFLNSRMKDFYDIWAMSRQFAFEGPSLSEAIRATFSRRKTALPESIPVGLSAELAEDADKQKQWVAFLRRSALDAEGRALSSTRRTARFSHAASTRGAQRPAICGDLDRRRTMALIRRRKRGRRRNGDGAGPVLRRRSKHGVPSSAPQLEGREAPNVHGGRDRFRRLPPGFLPPCRPLRLRRLLDQFKQVGGGDTKLPADERNRPQRRVVRALPADVVQRALRQPRALRQYLVGHLLSGPTLVRQDRFTKLDDDAYTHPLDN